MDAFFSFVKQKLVVNRNDKVHPRSNPLPFYMPFWKKRYPFYIPFIEKRYPFHIPTLGRLVLIYI